MENSIIGGEGVGSARVIFHIQFLFFFPNGIKINFRQGFFFMYRGGPPLGLLKPPPPRLHILRLELRMLRTKFCV